MCLEESRKWTYEYLRDEAFRVECLEPFSQDFIRIQRGVTILGTAHGNAFPDPWRGDGELVGSDERDCCSSVEVLGIGSRREVHVEKLGLVALKKAGGDMRFQTRLSCLSNGEFFDERSCWQV
jgi:hypothetical protein